jgi:hypothetical protein
MFLMRALFRLYINLYVCGCFKLHMLIQEPKSNRIRCFAYQFVERPDQMWKNLCRKKLYSARKVDVKTILHSGTLSEWRQPN